MIKVFVSYSHQDEDTWKQLRNHLASMERKGIIKIWFDRKIIPGQPLDQEIKRNLAEAKIVLLLVSANFISSDYCHDVEMKYAMEQHEKGSLRVVPVIVSACDWKTTQFGNLLAVPTDGKPITSWENLNDALFDSVEQLKRVIEELKQKAHDNSSTLNDLSHRKRVALRPKVQTNTPELENDNLTIKEYFTEAEKDKFLSGAFDHISKYIETSLKKLESKYAFVTTNFRQIDADSFTATIYKNGTVESHCKVCHKIGYNKLITYSEHDQVNDDSYTDSLSVEQDGKDMYLQSLMGIMNTPHEVEKFTHNEAAKYYWSKFIKRLQ